MQIVIIKNFIAYHGLGTTDLGLWRKWKYDTAGLPFTIIIIILRVLVLIVYSRRSGISVFRGRRSCSVCTSSLTRIARNCYCCWKAHKTGGRAVAGWYTCGYADREKLSTILGAVGWVGRRAGGLCMMDGIRAFKLIATRPYPPHPAAAHIRPYL